MAVRSAERRRPEMLAQRRAAAAAAKRTPALDKQLAPTRVTKRRAAHQSFQPRKFN